MFGNKDKKEIREIQKTLNREFDAIIQAYDTSKDAGEVMLKYYIQMWNERVNAN